MLFSSTKMENAAQTGVFLKKNAGEVIPVLVNTKDFSRKLTLNILTAGFLLVLPKLHSFDQSIDERIDAQIKTFEGKF